MGGAPWAGLEVLYRRAQGEDLHAWRDLEAEVVPRLLRWIRKSPVPGLAPWELEDISRAAFQEALVRIQLIPHWQQAWRYAQKAALRLTLQRLRKLPTNLIISSTEDPGFAEPADPQSLEFIRQADFFDELEVLLRHLSRAKAQTVLFLAEMILEGDFNMASLAERLGISVSTLDRRLRSLRSYCQRFQ